MRCLRRVSVLVRLVLGRVLRFVLVLGTMRVLGLMLVLAGVMFVRLVCLGRVCTTSGADQGERTLIISGANLAFWVLMRRANGC